MRDTTEPNYFYKNIKQFILDLRVTRDELLMGSLKLIKSRIRNTTPRPNPSTRVVPQPYREYPIQSALNEIHNPIMDNKEITFNFKRTKNFLKFPSFGADYGLPGNPGNCTFCDRAREFPTHLFRTCPISNEIWQNLGRILTTTFQNREIDDMEFDTNDPKKLIKIYVISHVTRQMWRIRQEKRVSHRTGLDRNGFWYWLHGKVKKDYNTKPTKHRRNQAFTHDFRTLYTNLTLYLQSVGLLNP